jgi:hypothetical protein
MEHTSLATSDFPEFFKDTFNPHMFLINHDDDNFTLYPPNQCDWFFIITKVAPNTWIVSGTKDDIFSFSGPEECEYTYTLVDGKWCAIDANELLSSVTTENNAPRTPQRHK